MKWVRADSNPHSSDAVRMDPQGQLSRTVFAICAVGGGVGCAHSLLALLAVVAHVALPKR